MGSEVELDVPSSPCSSDCSEVKAEQVWREGGEHLAMSRISEKMVEEKEQQLREYIRDNYTRIKGVEKELANMQFELKLAAGPKRSALEMLRKKIEDQNEHVLKARSRHREARKVMAATEEELDKAEAVKDRLCSELNLLVQQSARIQLQKLEQLTDRLEQLHVGSGSRDSGSETNSLPPQGPNSARSASAEPRSITPTRRDGGLGGIRERCGQYPQTSCHPLPPMPLQMSSSEPMRKSASEKAFRLP